MINFRRVWMENQLKIITNGKGVLDGEIWNLCKSGYRTKNIG